MEVQHNILKEERAFPACCLMRMNFLYSAQLEQKAEVMCYRRKVLVHLVPISEIDVEYLLYLYDLDVLECEGLQQMVQTKGVELLFELEVLN